MTSPAKIFTTAIDVISEDSYASVTDELDELLLQASQMIELE